MKLTDALISEKSVLEKELSEMEPKQKRLQLINALLSSYGSDINQTTLFEPSPKESNMRFSKLGLSDAIMAAFRERPLEIFSPRKIRDIILEGGFKTESENLLVMVSSTCKRKTESKKPELEEVDDYGHQAFRFKML